MSAHCEVCHGEGPIPGMLWNAERCDTCTRFNCDHTARLALIESHQATLRALEAAVAYLEANRPKGSVRKSFSVINEYENGVLKPARAAIAKANGGQP